MSHPSSRQRPGILVALRIYRRLLCLYPRAFRQRFADEMAQVFGATCHEALHQGGWWSVTVVLLLAVPDVVITASRARLAPRAITGGNAMRSRSWLWLGSLMAPVAVAINIGVIVLSYDHGSSFFLGAVMPAGLRLLGQIATLFVLVGLMMVQRTEAGRLLGGVALLGSLLRLLLVDIWLVFPALNEHPHLYSLVSPLGGLAWVLALVGGVGLGITTVRSHDLGRWSSMPLLWQMWPIFGGIGTLLGTLVAPLSNPLIFILGAVAFIALPTWCFLLGTAIGLWQMVRHSRTPVGAPVPCL